jgi:lysozyme
MLKAAADSIMHDEGLRLKPYHDTKGNLTIGYGRNLDMMGISLEEAQQMLNRDISLMAQELGTYYAWFNHLDNPRKVAVINMYYNLGYNKFADFKRFRAYMDFRDYEMAAKEMLDSKWAKEVGDRAFRLAKIIKEG